MPIRLHQETTYHIHTIHRRMCSQRQPISLCQVKDDLHVNTYLNSLPRRHRVQQVKTSRSSNATRPSPLRRRPRGLSSISFPGLWGRGHVEGMVGADALRDGFPLLTIRGNYVVDGSTSVAMTCEIRLPRLFALAETRCRTVRSA